MNINFLCSSLKYAAGRSVPCLVTDQMGKKCWWFCCLADWKLPQNRKSFAIKVYPPHHLKDQYFQTQHSHTYLGGIYMVLGRCDWTLLANQEQCSWCGLEPEWTYLVWICMVLPQQPVSCCTEWRQCIPACFSPDLDIFGGVHGSELGAAFVLEVWLISGF